MKRVAVLVSGGGTNLQALLDAKAAEKLPNAEFCGVVSSNPAAYALERAKKAGIPAYSLSVKEYPTRDAYNAALLDMLQTLKPDFIVLAGYLYVLTPAFLAAFPNQIINVHPSLIPAFCGDGFYGLRVHKAALQKGVKVTGATVHYVNEIVDGGEILFQQAVPVLDGDTPESLQKRVMEQAEWVLLPKAVAALTGDVPQKEGDGSMFDLLKGNPYPGRGIVVGRSDDGKSAVMAYFIMGRSENSRNRVFVETGDGIETQPFDPEKVEDPSLIIYAPVRVFHKTTIVTNGDQTDTIYEGLENGCSFQKSLRKRTFEPDAPNFTPRISAVVKHKGKKFTYKMAILKSNEGNQDSVLRQFFEYSQPVAGQGHFIHTYQSDGNPLPSFKGEPVTVSISGSIDQFTESLWNSLNSDNKISLFVRYLHLKSGKTETRILNKYN